MAIQQANYAGGIEVRGALAVLYDCADPMVLVEGRRGTSKTTGICKRLVDLCAIHRGSRHLICRQTRESLTESVLPTLERVIGPRHPEVLRMARTQRHSYELYGSEIVLGGLDKPSKLYSTEWDTVYVPEAIETTQDAVEQFHGCMRHFITPVQQIILDTNPGAPGHWLNQQASPCPDSLRRVETREDYARLDEYNAGPQTGRIRRLVSVFQDNPFFFDEENWCFTEAGQRYIKTSLAGMIGHQRQRFFEGRWVAASGEVFPEYEPELHVIDDFEPPEDWPQCIGLDPGYGHPTAVLWFTLAPDGTIVVYDEIHAAGRSIEQHCQEILERNTKNHRAILRMYADPQQFFSNTAVGNCSHQAYKLGLRFIPWPRTLSAQVAQRVDAVRQLLMNTKLRQQSRLPETTQYLKICRRCVGLQSNLSTWSYKRTRSVDLPPGDDAFVDADNDATDVVLGVISSGWLQAMHTRSLQPEPEPQERWR